MSQAKAQAVTSGSFLLSSNYLIVVLLDSASALTSNSCNSNATRADQLSCHASASVYYSTEFSEPNMPDMLQFSLVGQLTTPQNTSLLFMIAKEA